MVVSVLSQEVTFVIKSIDSSQSTYIETLYIHLMVMKISALAQIVVIVATKMLCRNMRYEWIVP